MVGLRFVLLNILLSIVVSLGILALGWWWFTVSYLPTFQEQYATTAEMDAQTAALIQADRPPIPDMVANTLPAVASIIVTAEVPLYEQYLEEVRPFGQWWGSVTVPRQRQIGTEEQQVGGGSGFFVTDDGYLITNRHVVAQDNMSYSVVTNDGRSFPVTVVARDPMLDIAVLRVHEDTEATFAHLAFSDAVPKLGESVVAIGNALAEFPNSVSVGVVSGLSRTVTAQGQSGMEVLEGVIQTDAAINRGNSGGPLLNTDGEVVGVNVAMAGNSENIGFALPGVAVAQALESVLEHGEIIRPYLGVRYVSVTENLAAARDLPVAEGILITGGSASTEPAVVPDTPAARAGLQEGDIIVRFGDTSLDATHSLATVLRTYAPGDTVTLEFMRAGETREVEVTLTERPEE